MDVAHIRAQEAAFTAHVGNGDTFLHVTRRYASLGPDTAKDLFERTLKIHVWLRAVFELAEGREFPTCGFTDDEYDSRVLARVVSERTRERFRNAINAGLAAGLAAAINAGLDVDALAEAVDAEITDAINRNVAETISDLIGDAAEAQ